MFMAENKPANAKRRRLMPGQGRLIVASILIALGAVIPWLQTGLGTLYNPQYLWLFVFGFVALSGGLVPWRPVAFWHAVAAAVVTLGLSAWYVWQLVTDIVTRVGFSGWLPGPGMVLTIAGGIVAIGAARTLAAIEAVPAAQT